MYLSGRYDNPIPTRFLAPIDCLKIPEQLSCYYPLQSFPAYGHSYFLYLRLWPFSLYSRSLSFPLFTWPFILFSCSLSLHLILVSHPSYFILVPYLYIWFLSLILHTLFLFPTFTFYSCLSPYILYSCSLLLHLILVSNSTYFIIIS
jgi:hypothetical protein